MICNIAAAVGYYLLFQYTKTQSAAAASLTSAIDLGQQKNSRLSSLRATVKDTDGKRQQLETFLLSSDTEIAFIEQMESLAKNSGLSAKTNNVSSIAGEANLTKVFKMQMEVTGSWSNIMYLLDQVESLPYGVRVIGVSLNRQSAGGKSAGSAWVATFEINVIEKI
jgi:Tfp pilus assembly protein PilO